MNRSPRSAPVPYECFSDDDKRPVIIPLGADVAEPFMQDGKYAPVVASVLQSIQPFDTKELTYTARRLRNYLPLRVVQIDDSAEVVWARPLAHRREGQGLAPFVYLDRLPTIRELTVHLERDGRSLRLRRAYAGPVQLPLPWMDAARAYPGGLAACKAYWQRHAFVARPGAQLAGTQTTTPPAWAH